MTTCDHARTCGDCWTTESMDRERERAARAEARVAELEREARTLRRMRRDTEGWDPPDPRAYTVGDAIGLRRGDEASPSVSMTREDWSDIANGRDEATPTTSKGEGTMHEKWPPVPRPEGTPTAETSFRATPQVVATPCPSKGKSGAKEGNRRLELRKKNREISKLQRTITDLRSALRMALRFDTSPERAQEIARKALGYAPPEQPSDKGKLPVNRAYDFAETARAILSPMVGAPSVYAVTKLAQAFADVANTARADGAQRVDYPLRETAEKEAWHRGYVAGEAVGRRDALAEAVRECEGEKAACERHQRAMPRAKAHQVGAQIAGVCAERVRRLAQRTDSAQVKP